MKYIMANGAYDILHPGHIALLNYAKSLGDYLMVAIDADSRISKAKGPDRPVNNLQTRKCILENLKAVDEVRVFTNDEELGTIIKEYNPDVRVLTKCSLRCELHRACSLLLRSAGPKHAQLDAALIGRAVQLFPNF